MFIPDPDLDFLPIPNPGSAPLPPNLKIYTYVNQPRMLQFRHDGQRGGKVGGGGITITY
jgi:hypothetical protein